MVSTTNRKFVLEVRQHANRRAFRQRELIRQLAVRCDAAATSHHSHRANTDSPTPLASNVTANRDATQTVRTPAPTSADRRSTYRRRECLCHARQEDFSSKTVNLKAKLLLLVGVCIKNSHRKHKRKKRSFTRALESKALSDIDDAIFFRFSSNCGFNCSSVAVAATVDDDDLSIEIERKDSNTKNNRKQEEMCLYCW